MADLSCLHPRGDSALCARRSGTEPGTGVGDRGRGIASMALQPLRFQSLLICLAAEFFLGDTNKPQVASLPNIILCTRLQGRYLGCVQAVLYLV
jgi:hypothetical protein